MRISSITRALTSALSSPLRRQSEHDRLVFNNNVQPLALWHSQKHRTQHGADTCTGRRIRRKNNDGVHLHRKAPRLLLHARTHTQHTHSTFY